MWKTGILSEAQPKQLCETVLYLLGLHLALRGGDEHKRLHQPGFNPQIEITTNLTGNKMLVYHEDLVSKTHQGGIDSRKTDQRIVNVYVNPNEERCPVRLYEKYMNLLLIGGKHGELYLYPMNKPTEHQ